MATKSPGRRSAKTVIRIIEAAQIEFGLHGLDRSTMKAIALRAGVSEALVFHYYHDKASLYEEVLDHYSSEIHARILAVDSQCSDPIEQLSAYFSVQFDEWNGANANVYVADSIGHARSFVKRRGRMAQDSVRHLNLLNRILERGKQMGVIRTDVTAEAVYASGVLAIPGFFAAMPMLSRYADHDFSTKDAVQAWREYAVNMLVNAVLTPGPAKAAAAEPERATASS